MTGLLALLKRQWVGLSSAGMLGRSPYPDFDQEERESLQERSGWSATGITHLDGGCQHPSRNLCPDSRMVGSNRTLYLARKGTLGNTNSLLFRGGLYSLQVRSRCTGGR